MVEFKLQSILRRTQKVNLILFGIMAFQMFIIPIYSGLVALEYLPPGGIFLVFCGAWLVAVHFYSHPLGKIIFILTSILTIFLTLYWFTLFSGPFDRMLQIFMVFSFAINVFTLSSAVSLPILNYVQKRKHLWNNLSIKIDEGGTTRRKNNTARYKKKSILVLAFFIGALIFTPAAVYDFGRVYRIQAPDSATTRSSFWGAPDSDSETASRSITPIDNSHLLIENDTLSSPVPLLCPGSIMYVTRVTHSSTSTFNYCDYLDGAKSYPNGTVVLSTPLPSLMGVAIQFKYLKNSYIYSYLSQLNSRIVHTEGGGNQSWIESTDVFDNIEKTHEYLLLEYWNISYFIHIHVPGFQYANIYNYNPFTARAMNMVDWIAGAQPKLNHCHGIAFDWEPKEVKIESMNPDRPDIGIPPETPLISEEKWIRLNEQDDKTLAAARETYFNLFDHAAELDLGIYGTYVNYGMEDLAEGDIDYTRLPLWPHPSVEYGMMSYQSKDADKEAMWQIYMMNKNQQRFYGDQGYTLLTGWLTFDEDVHLKYYTNDEPGLERYIRDIKLHQACGARELFHAPLHDLVKKWGDEVLFDFEAALNTEPKEEFVFTAHPWGHIDTALYDVAENYNKIWFAVPVLVAQMWFLCGDLGLRLLKSRNWKEGKN